MTSTKATITLEGIDPEGKPFVQTFTFGFITNLMLNRMTRQQDRMDGFVETSYTGEASIFIQGQLVKVEGRMG